MSLAVFQELPGRVSPSGCSCTKGMFISQLCHSSRSICDKALLLHRKQTRSCHGEFRPGGVWYLSACMRAWNYLYPQRCLSLLLVLYAVKKVKTNNSAITASVMVPFYLLKIVFHCVIFMGICGLRYVEKL